MLLLLLIRRRFALGTVPGTASLLLACLPFRWLGVAMFTLKSVKTVEIAGGDPAGAVRGRRVRVFSRFLSNDPEQVEGGSGTCVRT